MSVPRHSTVERLLKEAPKVFSDMHRLLAADKLNAECSNVEFMACARCFGPRLAVSVSHPLSIFIRELARAQVRWKPDLSMN